MQLVMSLQAPGENHFGAMLCRSFQSKHGLRLSLFTQTEDMRLRSCRFHGARKSRNLQVLILGLQEDFSLACRSLWICRNIHSPHGLQDLRNAQEALLHGHSLPVHSPDQVPRHAFEKYQSYLAPQGLSFVDPVLPSCQGLVLGHVQDHVGLA